MFAPIPFLPPLRLTGAQILRVGEMQARSVALAEGRITLTFAGGRSLSETVMAAHVMSALPPRLMADSIALTPAMDAATVAMWRATPTWMAPHAKVFAVYDRPFWRDAGLSGMAQSLVGPLVEIHDATTASGRAALFGFVGVLVALPIVAAHNVSAAVQPPST